ncbi:Rieske 2Fe-2S domain-containing protein [Ferviditalea candida]|uniref:Rieske 2Fe-2S domain-containing protein n=1 Tax=Ferviditalea candida TaxID=3108399 RepID=A0ABU5ZF93_9BACL|nr:Rieske 2Fe-2S domain-containing protein [Paenibacillaceae bacterium T2]
MLTKEQNELLTRVEGDAPMGKMLRQYWLPALRSEALVADGDPVRVRLFGQNFVAFRGTDGKAAIFDEGCPHRGASLLLARNEDCALTCIFHGWKFGNNGKTVDVPTEPKDRREAFAKKVPLKSYPVKEAGTMVWVWLGEGEVPEFPMLKFNTMPDTHVRAWVAYVQVNWLQGLEATVDTAHVGVLHKSHIGLLSEGDEFEDIAPRYDIDPQPYGLRAAALRRMKDGSEYVRVTEYVAPWYSFIPQPGTHAVCTISTPIDDYNVGQWYISFDSEQPLSEDKIQFFESMIGPDPNNFYNPKGTFENRWLQDRELMKQGHFSGVQGIPIEDFIVEESMGPIADRTKEFLGSTDIAIARMRRMFLKSLEDFKNGLPPFALNIKIDYSKIKTNTFYVPKNTDWRDKFKEIAMK